MPVSYTHLDVYKRQLYGQFKKLQSIDRILWGLKNIGFDAVFEVALGADVVLSLIHI